MIWKDVWKYASNESYQIVQGFYAMSLGGIVFGTGLYNGYPKLVPFIYGFHIYINSTRVRSYFGIGLLLLYFLLFYRGIRAALNTDDPFSQLNAVDLVHL